MTRHRFSGSRCGFGIALLLASIAGCSGDDTETPADASVDGPRGAGGSTADSGSGGGARVDGGTGGSSTEAGTGGTQGTGGGGGMVPDASGAGGSNQPDGSAGAGGSTPGAGGSTPGTGGADSGAGGTHSGGGGTDAGAGGADAGLSDASSPDVADVRADAGPKDVSQFVTMVPVSEGTPAYNGYATKCVNAMAFKRNALTTATSGNTSFQFTSYFNGESKLVIGRRTLGSSTWYLKQTIFTNPDTSTTNTASVIAVDGSGRLHVLWGGGVGGTNLKYSRSTGSVLNADPIQMVGDDADAGGSIVGEIPLVGTTTINNPELYNVPGTGDLLLGYQNRGNSNGDYLLARWVNAGDGGAGYWTPVHTASPPLISKGTGNTVYPNQFVFDNSATPRLIAMWTLRINAAGSVPAYNKNVFYGQSANQGVDWTKMDGTTAYQSSGVHLIDDSNAELALTIGPETPDGGTAGKFNMLNNSGATVDKNNHPIFLNTWVPQLDDVGQVMMLWHNGTAWQTRQITERTAAGEDHGKGDILSRPIGVVDDDNRLLVVYRDSKASTNGVILAYSESADRNDWRKVVLTTENLGSWEPMFDLARWKKDGVLDILYQPCNGAVTFSSEAGTSTPVSVLEFNAKGFFAP